MKHPQVFSLGPNGKKEYNDLGQDILNTCQTALGVSFQLSTKQGKTNVPRPVIKCGGLDPRDSRLE